MKVFKLVSFEKDGNKCKFLNINYKYYIDNQHQFAIIIYHFKGVLGFWGRR